MASYVLVVDDEEPIRSFLRRRLEGWGYTVRGAGSATAALELMVADPATIAIIDIGIPGHDGLWLAANPSALEQDRHHHGDGSR